MVSRTFKSPAVVSQVTGFVVVMALGAAAGYVAGRTGHVQSLDPVALTMVGAAAGGGAFCAITMVEPAWLLTVGLFLSVFSGNWGNVGVPVPLDRVAIALGFAATAWQMAHDRRLRVRATKVHWLMAALILYAVASAAWVGNLSGHGPLFALLDRLGVVPFLLYLVAPVTFGTARQRRILAVGLLILGAYLGLVTLFEAVNLNSLVIPHYILNPALGTHAGRGRGPFLEAGANGLALFECLVASVVTWSWWRDPRMKALVLAVVVLCAAGILFTLTRQTWVGAAGGSAIAMLASRRLRIWLPLTAIAVAVVVALALAFVPGLSASVSQRASAQAPIWDRLNSDAAALRMVEARPALGFGWGTFASASPPYYRLASTYPLTSVGQAHNVPLSNAAELGLVGLGLWLVILIGGLGGAATRRVRPEVEPWRIGFIAVAVAWFIQCQFTPFDYAFDNYVVWLWAGLVSAGATAGPDRRETDDDGETRRWDTAYHVAPQRLPA